MWGHTTMSLLVAVIQMIAVAEFATIDEIISDATEDVQEFALFQGSKDNPSVKVEMDMVFTARQWNDIQEAETVKPSRRKRRKAIRRSVYRWPGAVIPVLIAPQVFTSTERGQIMQALSEWERHTCITFRQAKASDRNRIRLDNGGGCYSNVGMIGGEQKIGLATGCRYRRVVVHEVGHALGFHHEQTRPDRDARVEIVRRNIPPHLYYNFHKYTATTVSDYDVPYDYRSVMHYGAKAFSVNGGLTIRTKDPKYQFIIGEGKGLSFRDIKLANLMYHCNAHCDKKTCPGEGFLDKSCKCMCPGSPVQECSGTGTGTNTGTRTGTGTGTETTTAGKVTSGGTPPTVSKVCADRHRSCRVWAARGNCRRYSLYMAAYCRKSCRVCTRGSSTDPGQADVCEDKGKLCEFGQRQGYCTRKFVTYMRSSCAKTCNACSVDTVHKPLSLTEGEGRRAGWTWV